MSPMSAIGMVISSGLRDKMVTAREWRATSCLLALHGGDFVAAVDHAGQWQLLAGLTTDDYEQAAQVRRSRFGGLFDLGKANAHLQPTARHEPSWVMTNRALVELGQEYMLEAVMHLRSASELAILEGRAGFAEMGTVLMIRRAALSCVGAVS